MAGEEASGKEFSLNIREKCYLCGRDTPYYKDQPIEKRDHTFIVGAGQLCKECYDHCEALRFYTSR